MSPVTPKIVRGCAARMLKTIAASADAKSASVMPKKPLVRQYMSEAKSIVGRTLYLSMVTSRR